MGQGSGSVTTFSRADGFTTIGRHEEIVPAGTIVDVQLLGRELQLADLVVIGSHCIGLDYLLGELQKARCALEVPRRRQPRRTRGREARRMRRRRHPSARPEDRRIQPAVPDAGARSDSRLRPTAGHRLSQGRYAVRGTHRGGSHRGGDRRCVMRDGESQPGQRHARADRSAARRRQAAGLRGAAAQLTTPSPRRSCSGAPTGA